MSMTLGMRLPDMDDRPMVSPDYAGEISCTEAWHILTTDPHSQLIDVRTQPEWIFSGVADLKTIAKQAHTISWKFYPQMEVNPGFVEMVKQVTPDPNTTLFFLCKTGGRSLDAAIAMTQAGYSRCYNVTHGFEGDRDPLGHRGTINGWKASALPWEQA